LELMLRVRLITLEIVLRVPLKSSCRSVRGIGGELEIRGMRTEKWEEEGEGQP
jgi:hypothetical protein